MSEEAHAHTPAHTHMHTYTRAHTHTHNRCLKVAGVKKHGTGRLPETTAVHRIFGGHFRSQLKCTYTYRHTHTHKHNTHTHTHTDIQTKAPWNASRRRRSAQDGPAEACTPAW